MIPPQTVNAVRAITTWVLRSVGVALVFIGAYLMIKKIAFGIGTGDLEMAYNVWDNTGEGHSLYRGVAMVLAGVPLALLSRPLASWIVVVPSLDCPACGYQTPRTEGDRCPECGLPGAGADAGGKA